MGIVLPLAMILAAARLFGALFRRLGQPRVCGEIAAGLALGPSLLGGMLPAVHAAVFPASAAPVFGALSEIGVVLLMFLVGLNTQLSELRARKGATCAISLAGIVVPFVLGLGLAELLHPVLAPEVDPLGFRLFVATAVSITAIPTLARILAECNLQRTHIAALTTTAAALDDVVGWTLLAAVTAIVHTQFSGGLALARLVGTVMFASIMLGVVRPWLARRCRAVADQGVFDRSSVLAPTLVAVCLGAAVTGALGLSGVFGSLLVGITLSGDPRLRDALLRRLDAFVVTLFLPLFFAYTGLRTDVGSVQGLVPWALCAAVIVVAVVGKIGGCGLAAAAQGLPARDAWSIGILMNTRGLMELVVANIGLDLGVINRPVFFALVMMAVVTTLMTTPLLRRALRHTHFAPLVERAAFARGVEPSPAR
jgi:Kef-type K+ transport system membrane component KefB